MNTPELSSTTEKVVKSLVVLSAGALVVKAAQYLEVPEYIRNVTDGIFGDPNVY